MKRMLIRNLKGGEILAQGICDNQGVQLLAAGTTYKKSYFHILNNLNIDYLYIKDCETMKDVPEEPKKIFNPDNLREESKCLIIAQLHRFEKIGSINIHKFEKFVFSIMNELMESMHIMQNLYIMKSYNNYTYEHSVNVTVIAILICNQMELSRYKTYEIAMGCMLHDLGKTKVSETILNKSEKLTEEEFEEIKRHPILGYSFVKDNVALSPNIKKIILTHHEKLDGSGYPLGLKGNEISKGARICAVSDVFDAMCSARPYKKAIPLPESIRTMKSTMNKELDMSICVILEEILNTTT